MRPPWIVGIGGSAGSLGPLKTILSGLRATPDAAFLVSIHRHATSDHFLSHALKGCTALPVVQPEDGATIEGGTIYVAPPNVHLVMLDNTLRLSAGPRENRARPSIDVMLRSIAVSCGSRAVGVILSGMQNDGSDGLNNIASCGGTTIVHDPADAEYPDMPSNAIRVGPPQHVADPPEIANIVQQLVSEPPEMPAPHQCPKDLVLERDISLGRRLDMASEVRLGEESKVTCPDCGGVLWRSDTGGPLKFRCHTGHCFTAKVLEAAQGEKVEEAFWVAMRTLRERAETLRNLAGRAKADVEVDLWARRASEADELADVLADSIMKLGRIG